MIMQAYQTLAEFNQTGISQFFVYPANIDLVEVVFIPLLLFTVFIISFLGGYYSQIRRRGKVDALSSFSAATFYVAVLAIIMSLIPNLINVTVLFTTIAFAVLGAVLLLIPRD